MRHFTAKECFVGLAAVVGLLLTIWFFSKSAAPFRELAPNLITDIVFGVFLVAYLDSLSRDERINSTKARRRATALSVQKFYQCLHTILATIIDDGINCCDQKAIPTKEQVSHRAEVLHGETAVTKSLFADPLPSSALFVSHCTGRTSAQVFPSRTAAQYLAELANTIDAKYLECLTLDEGWMQDDVVDALTTLKNHHLFAMCRAMQTHRVNISFWPENDVNTIAMHMSVLSKFFGPTLGHSHSSFENSLKDVLISSLRRAGIPVTDAEAGIS